MKIIVNCRFVSRKTQINYMGMTKGSDNIWLDELAKAVQPYKKDLVALLKKKKRLSAEVKIYSRARSIKLLDAHSALEQVLDQVTDILFPRAKGKTIPQTEDRHFWHVEAEKIEVKENTDEKVEIVVKEMNSV